jgi:AraC-like DNA-binding protein
MNQDSNEVSVGTPTGRRAKRASGPWTLEHVPNEAPDADFGSFREVLQTHYYPAKVSPLDGHGVLQNPRLSAIELEHLTVGYVHFGTAVSIDAGDLFSYHVDVPLRGRVVSVCGSEVTVASHNQAAVFSPRRHTAVADWPAHAAQLLIKLNQHSVEGELEGLLGAPVIEPIQFKMAMPTGDGAGRAWLATLTSLLAFLNGRSKAGEAGRRHTQLLERTLISGLLMSQPHSYTDQLLGSGGPIAATGSVDLVVDAIKASPEHPYSLADLCRIGCASARSLQAQFQARFGMSPMQFLRRERLCRAREALRDGRGPVSTVAYDWGFSNLGRFARAYQAQFGELPSDTLDKAGRRHDR